MSGSHLDNALEGFTGGNYLPNRHGTSVPVEAMRKFTVQFEMLPPGLKDVKAKLRKEIERGLKKETHAQADVKCHATYVQVLPSEAKFVGPDLKGLTERLKSEEAVKNIGNEPHLQPSKTPFVPGGPSSDNLRGFYLALDLGGTNIRVLSVVLRGRAEPHANTASYEIPKSKMVGSGTALFDYVAEKVWTFIYNYKLHEYGNQNFQMGVTFSFPLEQRGLTRAHLVNWTKGFNCDGVVGEDVVKLMQQGLDRKKRFPHVSIRIMAMLNDTTGCLMACARSFSCTRIGIIVGTGTNACYMEKVSNVETFIRTPETDKRPDRVIINTEWGAFGNNKCLKNYRTRWDDVLDAGSINPGKQIFEKMISGMYLGELVRLILKDAVKEGILFAGRPFPPALDQKDVINAAFLSKCEEDEPNGHMEMTRQELEQSFNLQNVSLDECRAVRKLCERVSVRAANLTAAALAVLMERVWAHEPKKLAIGADGSLFQKHPRFKARVYGMMRLVLEGPKSGLHEYTIEEVNDASGVGAAITAACHNTGLVPMGNTTNWPDGRQKAKSITKSHWVPDPTNETKDPKRTGSGSDLRRSPH